VLLRGDEDDLVRHFDQDFNQRTSARNDRILPEGSMFANQQVQLATSSKKR
jgi:hypothetical protein